MTVEDVLEQWSELKAEINGSAGLRERKFDELWPDVLLHYSEEYKPRDSNPKPASL